MRFIKAARWLSLVAVLAAPSLCGAQSDDSLEGEARGLYMAGVSAYDGGRYEEALRYFQLSYEKSGHAELLYNIASTAERVQNVELALVSYERFVQELPKSQFRARAETRIAALKRHVEAKAEVERASAASRAENAQPPGDEPSTAARAENAQPPRDDRPREPEEFPEVEPAVQQESSSITTEPTQDRFIEPASPTSSGGRVAPWLVLGGGVAALVAGGAMIAIGLGDRAKVEDPSPGDRWFEGADEAYQRGPKLLTTGAILVPVGVLAGAAGAWLALKPGKREDSGVSIRLGPGSFSLRKDF
jgi:tetratricopeptide (TPR) repeat protein